MLQIFKKVIFAVLPKKLFKVDWVEERDGSDVKTQLSDVEKPVLFF